MEKSYKFSLLLATVVLVANSATQAQEDDTNWQKVTSIEVDLSVYDLFDEVSAIVVLCTLHSSSPSGDGGSGYAVIYSEIGMEGQDISNRAYEDTWLERINFIESPGMYDGMDLPITVDIYADEIDYRFWTLGFCTLKLFNGKVSEASSADLIAESSLPTECFVFEEGEFYANAWRCSQETAELKEWSFSFVREEDDGSEN